MVAVATLGAGLIGAGASMYGSSKAADAASSASERAAALQQQQMAQNKANLDPFVKTGQGANNLLSSFYGINGSDPALGANALNAFQKSPDYQFALKEGQGAMENSAAAKGGLISGNQLRATTEFGQGLATQNLGNYLGRLTGISGQGIQAGAAMAGPNTTGAYAAGQSIQNAGNADAAGYLGMTKGINSGLNSLAFYGGQSSYGGSSNPYGGGYLGTTPGSVGSAPLSGLFGR